MFKIAIRNLFRNKLKTLITILLIVISSMIIFLAGGLLNSGKSYFEKSARATFSGDIVITGNTKSDNSSATLFGVEQKISIGGYDLPMPLIDGIHQTEELLDSFSEIEGYSKSVLSHAYLRPTYDELSTRWQAKPENASYRPRRFLICNDANYFSILPSIDITDGKMITPDDQNSIMISNSLRYSYTTYYERELNLGDIILLQRGDRFQYVTVAGFYNKTDYESICSSDFIFADTNSCKIVSKLILAGNIAVSIPDDIDLSILSEDDDEVFNEELIVSSDITDTENTEKNDGYYNDILGDIEMRNTLNLPDNDAWHFIHIRLKDISVEDDVIKKLNASFKKLGLNNRAVSYNIAIGKMTENIENTYFIFKCLVVFFSVIIFIVICNTLIVSVLEREGEIGTMRALGASKGFVSRIFFAESFCLASIGSIVGILLSVILALIINMLEISLGGMSMYIGRVYMHISLNVYYALGIFAFMNVACLIATIYPVHLASSIMPVRAMKK